MNKNTINQIYRLNEKFYNEVGKFFDSSRQYYWQGWYKALKLLDQVEEPISILDIGSGNGRFYEFMIDETYDVEYLGIEPNDFLIDKAAKRYPQASFQKSTLHEFSSDQKFDLVVSFGVFHHIPGFENRKEQLMKVSNLLNANGVAIIAFWQFESHIRNQKYLDEIEIKSSLNLNTEDLEDNDYILDWKRGVKSYRYAHRTTLEEAQKLASASELKIKSSYYADGKNEQGNLYCVLSKFEDIAKQHPQKLDETKLKF